MERVLDFLIGLVPGVLFGLFILWRLGLLG